MAQKQGGRGGGGGGGGDGASRGGLLFGIGIALVGAGGIAAFTPAAPIAPLLFGAGGALVVVGGFTYLGATGCFVQGTMVATAEGFVPIERIRAGDEVCTVDLDDGKVLVNRVVKTFRYGRNEILELGLGDETISCTPQHRFYRDGWVAATNLKPGDRLSSREGQHVELKTVRKISRPQFVYNFTVEGPHNYLVGQSALLVHNLKKSDEPEEPGGDGDP